MIHIVTSYICIIYLNHILIIYMIINHINHILNRIYDSYSYIIYLHHIFKSYITHIYDSKFTPPYKDNNSIIFGINMLKQLHSLTVTFKYKNYVKKKKKPQSKHIKFHHIVCKHKQLFFCIFPNIYRCCYTTRRDN